MTIMPIVVGALAFGLVMVFSLQSGVGSRITDAGDAQVASSTFLKDVQSAEMITEMSSPACGTGSSAYQLLGLEWGGTGGSYLVTVSYVTQPNPGLSSYSLIREMCTQGNTTSPATVTTVATDLAGSAATAPPYIECASNPVDGSSSCSSGAYATGWINAGDVQYVMLSAQEHALLPAPNQSTPFTLTLAAAPRRHVEVTNPNVPSGNPPLRVLGTSCSTPAFTITNNVTVSITVGGGPSGNGTLGLAAKCPAVEVDNGGVLNAGAILTQNPNLNSVYEYPSMTTYPIPEYYATPSPLFPGLPTPTVSTTSTGKCALANGTWTCFAGVYAQDPGVTYKFSTGESINFVTTPNCTPGADGECQFVFQNGLNLPSGVNVNFSTGEYFFWDNSGDYPACGTPNPEGTALSGQPSDSITGQNVLFYVECGSVNFQPGITINLSGIPTYDGITIWDTDSQNPLVIGNNSSGGASAGYGGIYVPNQGIQVNNDAGGVLTVSFMVAQSLTFKQNLTINITNNPT